MDVHAAEVSISNIVYGREYVLGTVCGFDPEICSPDFLSGSRLLERFDMYLLLLEDPVVGPSKAKYCGKRESDAWLT